MKNIYFLLFGCASMVGIKPADQSQQKLQLHPDAYKAIQEFCRKGLVERNFGPFGRAQRNPVLVQAPAAAALPATSPLVKPLAKIFLAVLATDETSKHWSNHTDLEIILDIDTKKKRSAQSMDSLPVLHVTPKSNTSQWIKINPNPKTAPCSFFEHRKQIYVKFQADSQDVYPISVSKLSGKAQDETIELPCVISSPPAISLPTTQPQPRKQPQSNGLMKKEKVIRSNLDILLNDKNRGSAGKYFDRELYNSEATTFTFQQAARNTIEAFRPRLKETEVQIILSQALYEKLGKPQ